jgi:hypothetical protein
MIVWVCGNCDLTVAANRPYNDPPANWVRGRKDDYCSEDCADEAEPEDERKK